MRALISSDLLTAIERAMPRGCHRTDPAFLALCERIQGTIVDLRFECGEAFADDDDNYCLPESCWTEVVTPMPDTPAECRAEFESGFLGCNLTRSKRRPDYYADDFVSNCWDGWQAAWNRRTEMMTNAPTAENATDPHVEAVRESSAVAQKLSAAGVFKGADGLSGLLNADEFWDKQMYGTRMYYGDGGADYLHRGVLNAAVKLLSMESSAAAELEALRAGLARLTQRWFARGVNANGVPSGDCDTLTLCSDEVHALLVQTGKGGAG